MTTCPSCAAEIEVDDLAHLVVCPYCQSTFVRDQEAARIVGEMAVLAEPRGPLFVGATGSIGMKKFRVIGRVRYGWDKGFWDEWFLSYDDGSSAWIAEDEENFTLEEHLEDAGVEAGPDDLRPGDSLEIDGTSFHVDERGTAVCEGGEGQLPFSIVPGEEVRYYDLSAGPDTFATVEWEPDGEVRVFRGERVDPDAIRLDATAEEAGRGGGGLETEQAAGTRERVVRGGGETLSLTCFSCAAPLEVEDPSRRTITCEYCQTTLDLSLRRIDCASCGSTVPVEGGDEAQSVVCSHCGTHQDISRGEPTVLGSLADAEAEKGPLDIGWEGTLRGDEVRVVGRVRYVEEDAWGTYVTNEYLLRGEERGYHWLFVYDGHWSISEEVHGRPSFDPRTAHRKQSFSFMDRRWKVYERGEDVRIDHVEGELPWVAKVGDTSSYCDCVSPPWMLSAEWTEDEMEYYRSEWIPREEVAEAFDVPAAALPRPRGVAPHQPYSAARWRLQAAMLVGVFALLQLLLGCWSWTIDGRAAGSFEVDEYLRSGAPTMSPPFEIEGSDALCRVDLHAPVDNSWVWVEGALVDSEDQAVLDFSQEIGYYHGRTGGESWSEGSRSEYVVFKVEEPGTYRILMHGEAGRWRRSDRGYEPPVSVTVHEGVALARWHLVLGILALAWPIVELVLYGSFQQKKWGEDE